MAVNTIELNELRRKILLAAGKKAPDYKQYNYAGRAYQVLPSIKLPADFSLEPILIENYFVKVMTSEDAKAYSPKSRVPHRIMVKCPHCGYWQFAGRLFQHVPACKSREGVTNV